ncbi:hypothetical protein ACHAWF_015287 [Thalassiosira exigua]
MESARNPRKASRESQIPTRRLFSGRCGRISDFALLARSLTPKIFQRRKKTKERKRKGPGSGRARQAEQRQETTMSGAGQFGEPDWASPDAAPPPAAAAGAGGAGATSGWSASPGGEDFSGAAAVNANANAAGLSNSTAGKTNCFQRLLSFFSMGLSAMMCCLGVFGILEARELAEIFVSIYMICFAFLLFFYELMWWKSIPAVNKNLRMNFGFLYGVKGKAAYLIFVAFLVIGLRNDVSVQYLRYLTGGCFLGTGVLMLFVHFTKPHLLGSYQAPTAGLGGDINNPV